MEHLRQIEEDLRSIVVESKKKYPEVVEAAEQALDTLKSVREVYVNDLRGHSTGLRLPQATDLASPYILICNYADCHHKLVGMALTGLLLLLNFEVMPVVEAQNILRVLLIQTMAGKVECQLKIIQIVLQLASLIARDKASLCLATDQAVVAMLTIMFVLCDSKHSASVHLAASGTIRQIIALILDRTASAVDSLPADDENLTACAVSGTVVVRELVYLLQGTSAISSKVAVPAMQVLDLLQEVLDGWPLLLVQCAPFAVLLKEAIIPSIRSVLRNLKYEYAANISRLGSGNSALVVNKSLGLVRTLLLEYPDHVWKGDAEDIIALIADGLRPIRDVNIKDVDLRGLLQGKMARTTATESDSFRNRVLEEASALLTSGGAASLLSKLSPFSSSTATNATAVPRINSNFDKQAFLVASSSKITTPITDGSKSVKQAVVEHAVESKGLISVHPVVCCIDILLAFASRALLLPNGCAQLELNLEIAALTHLTLGCGGLVLNYLTTDVDFRELEQSMFHSSLYKILTNHLDDEELHLFCIEGNKCTYFGDVLHGIATGATICNVELFLVALCALQFSSKIALRLALLAKCGSSSESSDQLLGLFLSPNLKDKFAHIAVKMPPLSLAKGVTEMLDSCYEIELDVCSILLKNCESTQIQRWVVTLLSELALASSVLSLMKPCQITLSMMCKNALPLWHGSEQLLEQAGRLSDASPSPLPLFNQPQPFKWKHSHMLARICQLIHVIADSVSDWDCVVDCLEQVSHLLLSEGCQIADRSKYVAALERLKDYSVFLSNDSLIKLMTSFVALSMNNIAIFSTGLMGEFKAAPASDKTSQKGSTDKDVSADVPYSIRAVIDISKRNSFRIASVWQMVISHLRMITGSKSRGKRELAVEAAFEIITSFVRQQHEENLLAALLKTEMLTDDIFCESASGHDQNQSDFERLLINVTLNDFVLPSLDSVFFPRSFYRAHLERALTIGMEDPKLCQADLLTCMLQLSAVRFEDVRFAVLRGLAGFLQSIGHMLEGGDDGGWRVVLELLGAVPLTHTTSVFRSEWINVYQRYWSASLSSAPMCGSDEPMLNISQLDSEIGQDFPLWPREALADAFSSTALVVDEFLEGIFSDFALVQSLLEVLSLFGSQTADTNISLAAVEVLWKVADGAIRSITSHSPSGKSHRKFPVEMVMEVMLHRLLQLALDSRPEVRHCAINTLFTALASNATLVSFTFLKASFEEVVVPLFDKVSARSQLAIRINEQAIAPELKKGVKMAVHHSRDTAHKQWSETRTMSLRGLLRVLKATVPLLSMDGRVADVWISGSAICRMIAVASNDEVEVALAGIDVLFSMLKVILDSNAAIQKAGMNTMCAGIVSAVWQQLAMVARCRSNQQREVCSEISSKTCEVYALVKQANFLLEDHADGLLEVVVSLAVQHIRDTDTAVVGQTVVDLREQQAARDQIRVGVVAVLNDVRLSFPHLAVRRACQICFCSAEPADGALSNSDIRKDVFSMISIALDDKTSSLQFAKLVAMEFFNMKCREALMANIKDVAVGDFQFDFSFNALRKSVDDLLTGLQAVSVAGLQTNQDIGIVCDESVESKLFILALTQIVQSGLQAVNARAMAVGKSQRNVVRSSGSAWGLQDELNLFLTLLAVILNAQSRHGTWLIKELLALLRMVVFSFNVDNRFKSFAINIVWTSIADRLGRLSGSGQSDEGCQQALAEASALLVEVQEDTRCDNMLRQSAVVGLVVIAYRLVDIQVRCSNNAAPPTRATCTADNLTSSSCSAALKSVVNVRCTLRPAWASLLIGLTTMPLNTEQARVSLFYRALWLASIASDQHLIPPDDSQPAASQDEKLHILALHDVALLAVVHCGALEIREAAFQVIRALDVVGTIAFLRSENRSLRTKVEDTVREVNMLKSVTVLPF